LFATVDSNMVYTAYIMDHLLWFTLCYIAIVAIVLYSRKDTTQ
jgi:hypothetical protein